MIGIKLSDNQVYTLSKKLTDNKIYVSFRGNNLRIAPHLYNDLVDIKRLFKFI